MWRLMRGASVAALVALSLVRPAASQQVTGDLKLDVVEIAQSVDLSRGKEKFLTVTVDVTGVVPARLRRVQPLRDDFQILAGKTVLPCRWLRGGTLPEDPQRLRFVLGFSLPPRGTKAVSLRANLPRLEGEDLLEISLKSLAPGVATDERGGRDWTVTIHRFALQEYMPPALPEKGQFTVKSVPVDTRVFRKPAKDPDPAKAYSLSLASRSAELYDLTLDVSGWLVVEKGVMVPLLSASMRRMPSRAANRDGDPYVTGEFHFPAPASGKVVGAVLRFHRRPRNPDPRPVVIPGLPVP